MAEQRKWYERQYPDAEFRKRARTTTDVLEEELGFYPDGPSFRGGLVAIGRIYEKTKLMQSCIQFAHLAVVASASRGATEGLNGMAPNFLAGETLAIHAILKPVDILERRHVLAHDIFKRLSQEEDSTILQTTIDNLADHRQEGWRDVLTQLSKDHQELLQEAATRAYDDIPGANNAETDFIAGYLYAGSLIIHHDCSS